MKYKLILNGLDCAHCASKIEKAISETDGFENVSLVFATKSLYFSHPQNDNLIEKVQKIADRIEDGVTVSKAEEKHKSHYEEKSRCHDCARDDCKANHGHSHEHNNKSKLQNTFLFIAVAFAITAIILDVIKINEILVAVFSAAAIVLSGYNVFISGVKSLFKFHIDETTLMTVAVISAFCLGQFVEGAMVTILFGIGELLEDKAVENSRRSIEKLANIQSDEAVIIENGLLKTVDADEVEIGTEIIIEPYAKIPLDCVVTDGESNVDTSAVTGESMPVLAKRETELLSGMVNGSNLLKAKTVKAYEDSTASRIIKLVEEASITKSKNEKLITRFAGVYTPIVILISLAIAFIPPIFLGNITEWIYRGLVCLVASCPCAIVISVPLSYYSGIGCASKHGVLFKGGRYLEALARSETMVFDKTGTLTEGKLTIEKIIPFKNYSEDDLLKIAASVEKHSTHPIARAIAESYNGEFLNMENYNEQSGLGVSAVYDGKSVRCVSKRFFNGKPKIKADAYLIYDGELIGAFKLKDKVRNEVKSVLHSLKNQGFRKFVLLTGDNKENADKILSEIKEINKCYSDLVPEDKLNIVNGIKDEKKGVCFVGDGINDAPVIAAADCGFAMGLGSDAAIASADAVLTSGNLSSLPKAVKIAKKTITTVKTNIAFALLIKAVVIILAFFGLAAIWMSVIADTGVCMLCVFYATRLLKTKL